MGYEVVAGGAEQVHPPGRLGGQDEAHDVGSATEEEAQLPPGALRGVGAVDEVVGHDQGEVAPDGARGRFGGVGGAHEGSHHLDGALAPDPHGYHGGRGNEVHELVEERLFAVFGVVLLGELAVHVHKLHVGDVQVLRLHAADYLADQLATHAVAFDQYQGIFHYLLLILLSSCRCAGPCRSRGTSPIPCSAACRTSRRVSSAPIGRKGRPGSHFPPCCGSWGTAAHCS